MEHVIFAILAFQERTMASPSDKREERPVSEVKSMSSSYDNDWNSDDSPKTWKSCSHKPIDTDTAERESKVGGVRACAPLDSRGIYCSVRIFCMMSKSKRVNAMLNRRLSTRPRQWSPFRTLKTSFKTFTNGELAHFRSQNLWTFVNNSWQQLTNSYAVNAHNGSSILHNFSRPFDWYTICMRFSVVTSTHLVPQVSKKSI